MQGSKTPLLAHFWH